MATNKSQTPEATKRIVLILGGKGGTGKTTFISLLLYWLAQAGVKIQSYDADTENPTFHTSHKKSSHPVDLLDLLDMAEARNFLSQMNERAVGDRPDTILIDMPGASGNQTRAVLDRFQFFRAAKMLGYRITICTILNTEVEPIVSLKQMMAYKDACDYVAVLPDVWKEGGKTYEIWQGSDERKTFLALNGIEIKMPILDPIAFQGLRKKHLSFFQVDELGFPDLLTGESFLGDSKAHLDRAAAYLGLPAGATGATTEASAKTVGGKA